MAEDSVAIKRALSVFGLLTQEEASRLVSMSRSTLTFTVTYRAVSSLVVDDGRGTALLGLAVLAERGADDELYLERYSEWMIERAGAFQIRRVDLQREEAAP